MLPATQFTHHWAENTSTNRLVVLSHQNSGIAVEANNRTIGTPHVLGGADDNGAVHIALFHAATRRSFLPRHDNDFAHARKTALCPHPPLMSPEALGPGEDGRAGGGERVGRY